MKFRFLFFFSLLLTVSVSNAQLLQWNTFGNAGTETTEPSTFNNANIAASNLTLGAGVTPAGNANRLGGNAWFDTGDSNPTTLAESVAGNDYIEFVINPNNGYSFTVTSFVFRWDRSGTGPDDVTLRSSIDGFTSDIGTVTGIFESAFTLNTINISGIANITTATTFRIYGYGATAAAGTGGFDGNVSATNVALNGTTTAASALDFYNLQFPGTAYIDVGNNFTAFAKAYEPGVTEAAGANPAVEVWIGYSTSNTNPSSAGWTWTPASYNVQVGNDDEYQLTFGAALPEGIYYYASRFSLSSGAYTYGGYSASNGGAWDGTTNVSGVLIVNGPTTPDYVNVQTPATGSILLGGNFDVYAQVYEPLITTLPNHQGEGIQAWIGYSTTNSDPSSGGWTWVSANFNILNGDPNNDEYMLNLGAQMVTAGTYYYASRFQLDSGAFRYGGILADGNPGGIWNGTTNISGVLTVAAAGSQEITVRGVIGSNPTISSGDTTPSGTDNTLFAEQNIGNSQTKSFRIQNVGSAPLTVSGITLMGGNPGDFTIIASAPYSIPSTGTNYVDFSITFSPTALGIRNTTVSIANNDLNENPYTFLIQGSGICNAATNTLAPTSGPVGTEVTVTATANNLTGATATINGVPMTVTPISATQIKVIVPAGGASGNITTTNSEGCSASTAFNVTNLIIAGCEGGGPLPVDLFISQITDSGADGLTYIEIYNGTGGTVNLGSYSLRFFNNGSATVNGGNIGLNSVNLLNGNTYTVATGTSGLMCPSVPGGNLEYADQTSGSGGINFKNGSNNSQGHDHIRLYRNTTHVDSWGVYENQSWATSLNLEGEGANFLRLNTATVPSTTYSNADWNIIDWGEDCADLDYSNIGSYDFSTATPPTVTAHPLFSPSCQSTSLTVAGLEGFTGGNSLAFQWYVNAPGTSSWTALTNTGVYTGATSATLNISDIAALNGYQYYAQVREDSATCYAASNATMVSASTSVWNAGAWTPSVPTTASGVTINGVYDTATHGSFDACSVTVAGGASLTIGSNDYVSIQNNLTVNATGSLLVNDSGSLVMINNVGVVTNNGLMQVERTTTPYKKYDYTYWSSPVVLSNIGTTFPGWRTDYSFTFSTANFSDVTGVGGTGPADGFDDDNNAWTPAPPADDMIVAKGYAIMAPTTGTFPATSTVTFSGRVNNGILSIPVALSANAANTNDDFNLIGNPYPSAVDGDLFISSNPDISGTLYFWTHNTAMSSSAPGPGGYNFITDDYAMYNLSGGTASVSGSSQPTGKIASGQGFFVVAVTAGNVTFDNAMRNKSHNNNDFFRTPAGVRDRLWLNFENLNGLFSQQLIGYFNESTNDADWGYDGIINPTQNAVSFYSLINDDTYRIQGRAPFTPTDMVPLGYKSVVGQFSISIGNIEGQLANVNTNVFLEDLLLDELHDLKQSPYTFSTEAGTFNERFVLRYIPESLSTVDIMPLTGLQAAVSNQRLSLRSSDLIVEVILYDMMGRKIYQATPNALVFTTNVIATTGVVVARIKFASGRIADRKIIF